MALVVSEETGRIAIAVDGKLTADLTREALQKLLTALYSRRDRPTLGIRKTPETPPDPGLSLGPPAEGSNGKNLPHPALGEDEEGKKPKPPAAGGEKSS